MSQSGSEWENDNSRTTTRKSRWERSVCIVADDDDDRCHHFVFRSSHNIHCVMLWKKWFQHSCVTARIRVFHSSSLSLFVLFYLIFIGLICMSFKFHDFCFFFTTQKKTHQKKIKTQCFISMLTNETLTSIQCQPQRPYRKRQSIDWFCYDKSCLILCLVIKITLHSMEQTTRKRRSVMGNKSISNHKIHIESRIFSSHWNCLYDGHDSIRFMGMEGKKTFLHSICFSRFFVNKLMGCV